MKWIERKCVWRFIWRVSKLRESGQMGRLVRKWWGEESGGCSVGGEDFVGMSLYETGTAFLVLLIAISTSLLLLSAELYFGPKPQLQTHTPHNSSSSVTRDIQQTLGSSIPLPIPTLTSQNTQRDKTHLSNDFFPHPNNSNESAHVHSDFLNYYQSPIRNTAQSADTSDPAALTSFFQRIANSNRNTQIHGKPQQLIN